MPARSTRKAKSFPPFAERLLAWYDRSRRVLPWRALPGVTAEPYRVWLSEIMLQQTVVKAAAPYFLRFVSLWPTVGALAAAELDSVLKEWAGLGYYARARNLHACARAVAQDHGGRFPQTESELLALPGIGRYTAAAIRAIAFNQQTMPVDGNVERVMARYFAVETPLPAAKPELTGLAQSLLPTERPGDLAQALMDLGASLCSPKSPACPLCPLNEDCQSFADGIAAALPRKAAKKAKPVRRTSAFIALREDGKVLLRKRPPRGLLGGMSEIPSGPWVDEDDHVPGARPAPVKARWRRVPGEVRHVFTHFDLRIEVWRADVGLNAATPDSGFWVASDALDEEALPSVMKKVAAHGL